MIIREYTNLYAKTTNIIIFLELWISLFPSKNGCSINKFCKCNHQPETKFLSREFKGKRKYVPCFDIGQESKVNQFFPIRDTLRSNCDRRIAVEVARSSMVSLYTIHQVCNSRVWYRVKNDSSIIGAWRYYAACMRIDRAKIRQEKPLADAFAIIAYAFGWTTLNCLPESDLPARHDWEILQRKRENRSKNCCNWRN